MSLLIKMFRNAAIAALILSSAQGYAQKNFLLTPDHKMKVKGTSTVHDWEMLSAKADGNAKISLNSEKISDINSLIINLPATSLKSGKSGMDEKAYEALRTKQHPQIRFELMEVESVTDQLVTAKGNLTIADNSRRVDLTVNYKVSDNAILFAGSLPIKLTDFNIDPPKAMFGTIKTGDDLTISFETIFKSID